MRKAFEVTGTIDQVKAVVENALQQKDVKLPVLNTFTNMANAEFPELGYVWMSWRVKDEKTTLVVIETANRSGVDDAFRFLFEQAQEEAEPKQEAEVIEENEDEKSESPNSALSVHELGLKGKAEKSFIEGSGCQTLGDVAKMSLEEISAISGVGEKTVAKIFSKMKKFGFELK